MALAEDPRWIDWEQEAYPAYQDFAALPFFALLFLVVRFFLDRFVFEVSRSLILTRSFPNYESFGKKEDVFLVEFRVFLVCSL